MLFFKPGALWFIIYVISIKSLELQKDHVTLSIYFVKLHFKASQLLDFLWKSLRKKTVRLIIFLSCQLHGSISRMRSAFFTLLKWHNLDLTLDETTLLPYFFFNISTTKSIFDGQFLCFSLIGGRGLGLAKLLLLPWNLDCKRNNFHIRQWSSPCIVIVKKMHVKNSHDHMFCRNFPPKSNLTSNHPIFFISSKVTWMFCSSNMYYRLHAKRRESFA